MTKKTLDYYGRDVHVDAAGRRYVVQSDGATYITDCCDAHVTASDDGAVICKVCFSDVDMVLAGPVTPCP